MLANTAASGSLQAFASQDLPSVVLRMIGGGSQVEVCQRLGAALFHTFGLQSIEIARVGHGDEGIQFAASADGSFALPPAEFRGPAGEIVLRVAFPDGDQQRRLSPLIKVASSLAELGRPSSSPPVEVPPPPPGPPEPRTLDPAVSEIYAQARRIAQGEIGVLIRGGSGSGKEVLSSFVHRVSPRAGKSFLALNCAALPSDLLEAELFGVERGVATGVNARAGMFERAHGGTLFLDEIGDMAPDTQARILRVMQDGEVVRVGGSATRPAKARILAATNRDLEGMIATGDFRLDLYHRLADWEVTLPRLRERRVDIPNLATFFLDRECSRIGIETGGLTRSALQALVAYPWPGNVRQLEREMVRAALFLEDGQPLGPEHLQSARPRDDTAEPTEDLGLERFLEGVERQAIERTIQAVQGDVEKAAVRLDIGRSTLYRRVKHLGIEV